MKRKKALIVLFFVLTAVCLTIFAAQATEQSRLRSEAEEIYRDVEVSDIIDNMKKADSLEDIHLDDFYALGEKIKKTDTKVLSFLIKNNAAFPFLQDALLQLAEEYDLVVSPKVIRALLHDDAVDPDVRLEALYYCSNYGDEYQKDMEALVYDGEYGFAAMRELYSIDTERALALSDEIIAEHGDDFSSSLDGAMYVHSRNLRDNSSTSEERKAYISLCEEIMTAVNDEYCRETLTRYIGHIEAYETLSYILDREDVEEIDKYQYIFSARAFMTSLLKEPAESEKTAFLTKAMKYCYDPIYYDAFLEYLAKNQDFFDTNGDLKQEAEKALAAMEQERAERHLD